MPIFRTKAMAEEIAEVLCQLVKDGLLDDLKEHQAAVGTGLTEVFCRAMLRTFPGAAPDGRDILQICPQFVATFPDPRRDAIHAAELAKKNSQLDN